MDESSRKISRKQKLETKIRIVPVKQDPFFLPTADAHPFHYIDVGNKWAGGDQLVHKQEVERVGLLLLFHEVAEKGQLTDEVVEKNELVLFIAVVRVRSATRRISS